jgi:hypothetical protein
MGGGDSKDARRGRDPRYMQIFYEDFGILTEVF